MEVKHWWNETWYKIARAIVRAWVKLRFRCQTIGTEKVPIQEKLLLIANHSNMWDPFVVMAVLNRRITFLAKREIFVPIFGEILRSLKIISVNRNGSDLAAARATLSVLKQGMAVGVFIQGTRVEQDEQEAAAVKTGAVYFAHQSKAPVLPVYLHWAPKPRYWWQRRSVVIVFGEAENLPPLVAGQRLDAKLRERMAIKLLEKILALGKNAAKLMGYQQKISSQKSRP